jgi:putative DNA primase/helicase
VTGWEDLDLEPHHATYLEGQAISATTVEDFGIRTILDPDDLPSLPAGQRWPYIDSICPGILFPWRDPDGVIGYQFRPDDPPLDSDDRPLKYVFPVGAGSMLGVMREDEGSDLALIVEGTKQSLVAAQYADEGSVYAVAGCRSWMADGVPLPTLSVFEHKRVVVIFDGDLATNRDVWQAAKRLGDALRIEGASGVSYALLPSAASEGLDDVLGARTEDKRGAYLKRLIDQAGRLPREPKPKAAKTSPFIHPKHGLQVAMLASAIEDRHPMALTAEHKVAVYRDGVFSTIPLALSAVVGELLGNQFRPSARIAVEEFIAAQLAAERRYLPTHVDNPMLNVRNGMLNLTTGELLPHGPEWLSTVQFPVNWDPDAVAPVYEAWLEEVIPAQWEDIEEVAAQMLDPSRTPAKALFAFGPSRSGKSTFLRLMAAMAGEGNVAAVTLHQLAKDQFAAANVFGKALNSAADLSAAHVEDLSLFKMMTGEDLIQANRKFGGQFTFTNRALFAFSANELPTVGEHSRAYTERIKPFKFGTSFAGQEDPAVEHAMMAELPGILSRWVGALQTLRARGSYLATVAEVQAEFATKSDRVRQWFSEQLCIVPASPGSTTAGGSFEASSGSLVAVSETKLPPFLTRRQLAALFNEWAVRNGGHKMQERKIIERLTSMDGVVDIRVGPSKTRALNLLLRGEDDLTQDDSVAEVAEPTTTPYAKSRVVSNAKDRVFSKYEVMGSKLPLVPRFDADRANGRRQSPGRFECAESEDGP